MKGNLLLSREFKCHPQWFDEPLKKFRKAYKSIVYAAYTKEERQGTREGFIVQKIGKRFYAIWFGQIPQFDETRAYPLRFFCSTGDTIVAKADTLKGAINGFVQNMPVTDKSQWQTL